MLEERTEVTTTPTEYEKRTYTVSEIQDILESAEFRLIHW